MTVICIPPTPTVRNGTSAAKPVVHTVLSLKKKVIFNERVRVRRRSQRPLTEDEVQAIWFSGEELFDRRRKDKKLRYAVARQPEIFGAEKLLVLGLYSEDERRQRNKRALAAQACVLSKQQASMDVDAGSDSDDSSTFTMSTPSSYALHSQAAASEAYERAVQHATHVQSMDNEDDSSEAEVSQQLSVRSETAPQKLSTMETQNVNVPQPQFVVCA
mmetsp:Transcript_36481/g.88407  ORF Transcript_36481/g.88407 Transcript_36481/m.88407 type:complete len:216 (+) Transcript_36481:96-743(+)|eukprot:CAMPEP_0113616136 /NCGR_PEP_ID=MMETSP0017_2-20120614/8079_1 /TAXON_ID=2856 /ORGANISM="Cylindrotheca closterium" /LENGTH=215 /DNA_ID=CAMNT_0000525431 /DNA_START=80 /DNA_END=727 /DNA_ORIENTATION=- /assembly_acc=CAM_ASM_000147